MKTSFSPAEGMPINALMIEDIEKSVRQAVAEVFATMLSITVTPEAPGISLANGEAQVASSVGFTGRVTGVVYLYSSQPLARRFTAGLLGMEEHEIEGNEAVNDAMGELTNMVVGHSKSRLSDRGLPCVLTIPSIVRGNFSIEPVSSTQRRIFTVSCNGSQLAVEILVKQAAAV